jgi:hypothetical protein
LCFSCSQLSWLSLRLTLACEVGRWAEEGAREVDGTTRPKDITRDIARDLSALVGELNAMRADANHWLTDPEYAALRLRLESAHAAAEAALVEARRRVRLNEES